MKRYMIVPMMALATVLGSSQASAQCQGCDGDIGVLSTVYDFSSQPGETSHSHGFGALCDARDIPDYLGEVYITVRIYADLEDADKYVTLDFISGTNTTPITDGNGFKGASSSGKYFDKSGWGVATCDASKNEVTVQLDYDDFNNLLAAGDGTMKIRVDAHGSIGVLCDVCCESGHSWTPDDCCTDTPPCDCPSGIESRTEVVLTYLDCGFIDDGGECDVHADCDDSKYCTGVESCVDGLCVTTGDPCDGTGYVCSESTGRCISCTADWQCNDKVFCNGEESCISGVCQTTTPCSPGDACDEIHHCYTPLGQ